MTKAEAIRILEQSCPKRPQKLWSIKRKEAVKMAIEALSAQPEPLPLEDEYVGAHCIKVCPVCYTPWTRPRTSEYLKKTKYPFCPCGQMIKWGEENETD